MKYFVYKKQVNSKKLPDNGIEKKARDKQTKKLSMYHQVKKHLFLAATVILSGLF